MARREASRSEETMLLNLPSNTTCQKPAPLSYEEASNESWSFIGPWCVALNSACFTLRKAFVALYATSGLDLVMWGVIFAFLTKLFRGGILCYGLPLDYTGCLDGKEPGHTCKTSGEKPFKRTDNATDQYHIIVNTKLYPSSCCGDDFAHARFWLANTSWINPTRLPPLCIFVFTAFAEAAFCLTVFILMFHFNTRREIAPDWASFWNRPGLNVGGVEIDEKWKYAMLLFVMLLATEFENRQQLHNKTLVYTFQSQSIQSYVEEKGLVYPEDCDMCNIQILRLMAQGVKAENMEKAAEAASRFW